MMGQSSTAQSEHKPEQSTPVLSGLIERLEKATGPDRELDLSIHIALNPEGDVARITAAHPRGFNSRDGLAWELSTNCVLYENWSSNRCWSNGGYPVPAVTSSIDAAMTLVPQSDDPTWHWRIVEFQEWNKGNSYWFWRARISGWPNMRPVYECGEHPIPAIALCIAALKAMGAK